MKKYIPRWLALGWLRVVAQYRCGRCMACPWCEDIKVLEGTE